MPDRFVILHHRQEGSEHWDLMLERGEVLWTWRLDRDPLDPRNYPIPAERIGDHRKAYLTYEGPISGGRGTVRRVDQGTYTSAAEHPLCLSLKSTGNDLAGLHRMEFSSDGSALFRRVPVSST